MVYDMYISPKQNLQCSISNNLSRKAFFAYIPQTVPAGVYTSDDFALYADNFDLSLLPCDGEVPLSPQSQLTNQQYSSISSDYIPATIFNDSIQINQQIQHTPHHQQQQSQSPSAITSNQSTISSMKTEKDWMKLSPSHKQQNKNQNNLTGDYLIDQQFPTNYQYQYPSPLPSPPQDNYNQFTTVYPPSPCSSVEYNNFTIKQEFGILPPSPPDSNGAPSPLSEIKTEPETESEVCIDIESLLNDSFEDFEQPKRNTSTPQPSQQEIQQQEQQRQQQAQQPQDHQLLREYLQDTTFQKKHNLKPLALESLLGGWGTRGDIEPVFSLALEQIRKDVEDTCAALDIPPDPQLWTPSQVQSWLKSQISTWKLQEISNVEISFPETGSELSQLSEDEFIRRIPESGATLYAQLVVWKGACAESETTNAILANIMPTAIISNVAQPTVAGTTTQQTTNTNYNEEWNSTNLTQISELTDDEDDEMPLESSCPDISSPIPPCIGTPPPINQQQQQPQQSQTPAQPQQQPGTTPRTGRQGGSHIHLWQFLKELLASPQTHGTAIRWLDRTKGVFKIEDSVRVARLWGRRKNRPAMNYDKLSRSIRQYYKKGIMKKTERSQRLVYQFCHPYCL